ncbi:MAG: hypothetical protein RRA15_04870 [bacterium]|nr:hypothetical protein [bacterium]MDT8365808.1 hypothetical protein [bacterium]
MKKNLGQLLIEKGLIDEKALSEALQRQVIFGGRLGTNLLEMGAVSEDALMRLLALQFNIPYAEPGHFEKIPKEVLDSVPKELISKHRIIPLVVDGHRITVAMTDPHKLNIIDEVAFQTNRVIQPVVASEVRIVAALERFYNIKHEARYIAVSDNVASEQRRISQPAREKAPSPDEDIEMLELTEADIEVADIEVYDPFDVSEINEPFFGIRNRDEVAHTVIKAGLRFVNDAFMFIIKGDQALGWMLGGSAKPVVEFGTLSVPVDPQNVLFNMRESRKLERFDGVEIFESNQWIKELSLKVPKEVLICPLVLKKHMVAALVGFSFKSNITDEEAEFLVRVMQKASVAFEILIMKSRIVML